MRKSGQKKSVRIAQEDEASLIQDQAPMPHTELYPLQESHTYYSIDVEPEREYTPPLEKPVQSNPFCDPEKKKWSGSTAFSDSETVPAPTQTPTMSMLVDEERGIEMDSPQPQRRADDDDEEFDWHADPDKPQKPRRRKTAKQRLQEAWNRPCCWHYLSPVMKRFIIAAVGSCIFILIAVSIYLWLPRPTEQEMADPNFANVRSNVQLWMYWAAFMWHIGWVTTVLVESVPSFVSLWTKLFRGRRSEAVKSSLEYYMALRRYVFLTMLGAWNWGSWAFLVDYPFQSVKAQGYSAVIWKVFACVFCGTCLLLVQKMIIQLIAIRFHRQAYDDRKRDSKQALKILDSLSKAEGRRRTDGMARRLRNRRSNILLKGEGADGEDIGLSSAVRSDAKRLSPGDHGLFAQFHKGLKNMVLTDDPKALAALEKSKMDVNSDDFARKVAKKLFYSLAYPHGKPFGEEEDTKRYLTVQDFEPYFATREETIQAFTIFDKDGNGDVSRREFRDTIVTVYRERKTLAQSMRDTSQALGKIDLMLLILSSFALLFIILAVFNTNIWNSLVPLGSLLLALTFVFGNTAKNTFESILFLFVTHPYDAGDYVLIDGQYLLVHNLGIMGTVFIQGDGQFVYAPTTVLMTKLISNVRRSGNMGESIQIGIDFETPSEKIFALQDQMTAWVDSQTRDFIPGFDLRVTEIVDLNLLNLTMWLPHKGNWQNLGKRFQRKTRFMIALKEALSELGIRYQPPTMRIANVHQDSNHSNDNNTLSKETPQWFGYSTTSSSRSVSRSNSISGAGGLDG